MKSVRNTRRALLLAITVLVSCIVSPGVTHATSSYDNTVTVAHNLVLDCADGSMRDLTYNWLTYLMTDASTLNGDPLYNVTGNPIQRDYFQGEFQTTLDNTVGWSVSQIIETNGLRYIMIFNNHANGLSFSNSGTVDELKGYATFLRISCQQYGSVQGIFMDFNNSNSPRVHANDNAQAIVNSEPQYRPFFVNQTVTYPSGYEGVILSATAPPLPPAKYVAMGDSFSSGEGNPPFEAGTAVSGVNECHRSFKAYPYLLSRDPSLDLWPTAFVACSGATTNDLRGIAEANDPIGKWGEPSQISVLSSDTQVVTVTIGGNDIGFKEFATACVLTQCSNTSSEYQESMSIMTDSGRSDYLPGKLSAVFAAMASELTSGNTTVHVYIIGYPKVVTEASWTETTSTDPNSCLYLSKASASAAETIITTLNQTVKTAVETYSDPRFTYVNPNELGSNFIGHELCRSNGYFHGIEASGVFGGNDAYIFHPDKEGQLAYRRVIGIS